MNSTLKRLTKVWLTEGLEEAYYEFHCPGCDMLHMIQVMDTPQRKAWEWNGDEVNPTFAPSYVTWTSKERCHSFIRNGNIEFLSDCTHELAGKTVPLPYLDSEGEVV